MFICIEATKLYLKNNLQVLPFTSYTSLVSSKLNKKSLKTFKNGDAQN